MNVFQEYARYYDLLYRDKDYEAEARYVDRLIRAHCPEAATILDLGCGTGNHAVCLAGLNYDVTGVDLSRVSITAARTKLESLIGLKEKVRFETGDIRSLRLHKTYDAVISLFHVMSYQTTNEPTIDVDVYSARVFEYLRDRLVSSLRYTHYESFGGSLVKSIRSLLSDYPGRYAFFLANESVLFAFSNFRQLMLLRESKSYGNSVVLTSIKEGLSDKEWTAIKPQINTLGKLIVVAGPDVLYLGDVAEGSLV